MVNYYYFLISGMSWLKGNAESLPLEDNVFDAYTIAFGIRNCTHIDRVFTSIFILRVYLYLFLALVCVRIYF
jgi:ubiquinone/menaquinone biosynthesis C-methylase UbiE